VFATSLLAISQALLRDALLADLFVAN